jgi:hypothetical protein
MISVCYISIKRKTIKGFYIRKRERERERERERQHIYYMATLHIFNRHFLTGEVAGNVIPQKQYDLTYFFEKRYISTWLILVN